MKTYIFHIAVPITTDSLNNPGWREMIRASLDDKMDQLMDAPEEDWRLTEVPKGMAAYAHLEFENV
jgi:hypothetical protein